MVEITNDTTVNIIYYKGKPSSEMTRKELINALHDYAKLYIDSLKNRFDEFEKLLKQ